MANLKYRFSSKLARVEEKKTDEHFIDSGETNHCFHQKGLFRHLSQRYRNRPISIWQDSHHCKGKLFHNIDGGITQEAYHKPTFSSNIISSHPFSEVFEIVQSTSIHLFKGFFVFIKVSFSPKYIVWETRCVNFLYPIRLEILSRAVNSQQVLFSTHKNTSSYEW